MNHKTATIGLIVFFMLTLTYSVNAEIATVKSCTDGYLTLNTSGQYLGAYEYISFQNVTCSPHVCATNGIMCNSPENVDRGTAFASGLFLLVLAHMLFFFSQKFEISRDILKVLMYFYIFIACCLTLIAILIIGGIYTLGPNEYESLYLFIYEIFLGIIVLTGFIIGISEAQSWMERNKDIGKSVRI